MLAKRLRHVVLRGTEGEIGAKDGGARRIGLVTVLLRSVLEITARFLFLGSCEIEVDGAAVDDGLFHFPVCFDTVCIVDKLHIAEPAMTINWLS